MIIGVVDNGCVCAQVLCDVSLATIQTGYGSNNKQTKQRVSAHVRYLLPSTGQQQV